MNQVDYGLRDWALFPCKAHGRITSSAERAIGIPKLWGSAFVPSACMVQRLNTLDQLVVAGVREEDAAEEKLNMVASLSRIPRSRNGSEPPIGGCTWME